MKLTPLPVRDDPYSDESLMGYAFRMSEANHFDGIRWLAYVFKVKKIDQLSMRHIPSISWLFGTNSINAQGMCVSSIQNKN
jgi:hypothetical protein